MNYAKTALLLAAMTALFCVIGFLAGGANGMVIAFFMSLAMNFFAYWNSDKFALSAYNARPVNPSEASELYDMLKTLSDRAGIPVPKLYVMDNAQPNAFATGRNPENAAVAVTSGLLRLLHPNEVMGVVAHELGHIKNRDTLIMTVTATLAGGIGMIVNFLSFSAMFGGGSANSEERSGPSPIVIILMSVIAPLIASIVQMAISRTREYSADRIGAQLCGDPEYLAGALEKIEAYARGGAVNIQAERNPATAHLFILNPLSGKGADPLFSTHPATANRVAALRAMTKNDLALENQAPVTPGSGFAPGFGNTRKIETQKRNSPWE